MSRDASASSPRARLRPKLTVLGVVSEVLIAAGALVGLFTVWQLFYTDVQGDRAQAAIVEGLEWVEPVATDPDHSESHGDGDAGTTVGITNVFKHTDVNPPTVPTPGFTDTFATMMVPRWGTDYVKPISEGTTRPDVLDPLGIGHYVGAAMPGEAGNFALAAHRTTYGRPFNRVAELQVGDKLIVQTEEIWSVYSVTDWAVVMPDRVDTIAPTPGAPAAGVTGRFITLTTCHPMFSARERWVVHGVLDYWAPVGHGQPAELTAQSSDLVEVS